MPFLSLALAWLRLKMSPLTSGESFLVFFFQKSARAAKEKNRAASVTMNADVRRTKARLLEEVVKLQKIAAKKVVT